jgi:threonine synthase
MNYVSTRGGLASARFSQILLEGLAPDGGLVIPEHYPRVSADEIEAWRILSYPELAFEIVRKFADDLPEGALREMIQKTYTQARFGSAEITPLVPIGEGLSLLRLSNGPSLAFKDIALQLLGHLFEYVLEQSNGVLNILGATSGDTGSAAEYAMREKARIRVFMLSPRGKMSPFQTAQMYSLRDENIFNIAIDGVFDEAQDIVKQVSSDRPFKARWHIGTVNSINWARIAAQVVYYFKGYFAATTSNRESVSFAVPSGNFGNIYAGHLARMMGLPIGRLLCATNENDVLDEFFRTGVYRVRSAAETRHTSSPSMDISKASNFERFVFDLLDRDAERVAGLWVELDARGSFDLSKTAAFLGLPDRFGFVSSSCNHADRMETIRFLMRERGVMIDPHTADGLTAARRLRRPDESVVVLETALPAKFAPAIREALGVDPGRPAAFRNLEKLPQRFDVLPPSVEAVKEYLVRRAQGAPGQSSPAAR